MKTIFILSTTSPAVLLFFIKSEPAQPSSWIVSTVDINTEILEFVKPEWSQGYIRQIQKHKIFKIYWYPWNLLLKLELAVKCFSDRRTKYNWVELSLNILWRKHFCHIYYFEKFIQTSEAVSLVFFVFRKRNSTSSAKSTRKSNCTQQWKYFVWCSALYF